MKLVYLYTDSDLTPWKENVNENTLNFLVAHTPVDIETAIVHFDGFQHKVLENLRKFDLVFNLSYGYKNDGQVEVAGWLEKNGIIHTASSHKALVKAQDKALLPQICKQLHINTPEILTSVENLEDTFWYLSKPRKGSCHRDITINTGNWMKQYLDTVDKDLIIQPYIEGREFSVAVIPDERGINYMALPPIEIKPEEASTIYIAGHSFGKTMRDLNPVLSDHQQKMLMSQAVMLHNEIGLKGMSRTDFRMAHDGTIYVLDVNAMPNMDPEKSLMPALCFYHGIQMEDLIQRMIQNTFYEQKVPNEKMNQIVNKPFA
jgi:D-alanine-D-alanine ligase